MNVLHNEFILAC